MYKYISNFNVRFTAVDMEKEEEYHIDYDQYYSICNSSYMVRWRDYCIALFGKFWHQKRHGTKNAMAPKTSFFLSQHPLNIYF